MNVAETIIAQLGGKSRLGAMISAHNYLSFAAEGETKYGRGQGGVAFKFKGSLKANYVRIVLDKNDTYIVEFSKLTRGGLNVKEVSAYVGIYADNLTGLFERETGLYLSL